MRAIVAAALLGLMGPAQLAAQGPPNPPINLEADVTSERVLLTWDEDRSGNRRSAFFYRIYRDDALLGSSSDEDFVDPGVAEGLQYTYEVSGVDVLGREGERSQPLTVLIPGGEPPGKPDNLVAEAVSASGIDLRWDVVGRDDDDGPEVVQYYIYRDGGATPHDSSDTARYLDGGLAGFTEYTYRVSAVSAAGVEGDPSDPASARTLDGSAPGAPADLVAEATGARRVELSWNPADDPETGIVRYLVYRDDGSAPIDSTATTAYTDDTVEPETAYAYRITARNGQGAEGPPSNDADATTPAAVDETPPSQPTNVAADAVSADRVELTWSAAQDPESGVSSYRVYRDDNLLGTSPGGGFVDLTVEPSTTYGYEVSALNGDGLEGARASAAPVTTPAEGEEEPEEPADTVPPAPPSGLRIVTG